MISGPQNQVIRGVQFESLRSLEDKLNRRWIGLRSQDEIELQQLPFAVENQVDAGINFPIDDFGVYRHVGSPVCRIVPQKVIDLPRQFLQAGYRDRGPGPA